jgi:hypothetical protein
MDIDDSRLSPSRDGLGEQRVSYVVVVTLRQAPGAVMDEMGHTDPGLALRVYRQSMRRDGGEKARLQALVEGTAEGHAAMAAALEHV